MWNVVFAGVPVRRWAAYGTLLGCGLLSPVRVGVVRGESMEPSLRDGQTYAFAPRPYVGEVSRGDVVVFTHEGGTYVKRVLAAAGESVYVLRYSDTDEVVPAWKLQRMLRNPLRKPPTYLKIVRIQVPADAVYVVGDHLGSSLDSRQFGPISTSAVLGRVMFAPPARPDFVNLAVGATIHRS